MVGVRMSYENRINPGYMISQNLLSEIQRGINDNMGASGLNIET